MSYKKISNDERNNAFALWCAKQSVNYVAEKTGLCRATVDRFRKEDKWDERLERIKLEAQIIADAKSSKRVARNLEIIKFLKEKIVLRVSKDETEGHVSDVPALIKTEELLVGNPDSRPEIIHREPAQIRESVERFGNALGLRISLNGVSSSRISDLVAGTDTPPQHGG